MTLAGRNPEGRAYRPGGREQSTCPWSAEWRVGTGGGDGRTSGENYLQEAPPLNWMPLAGRPATWHFIGALQSNKNMTRWRSASTQMDALQLDRRSIA